MSNKTLIIIVVILAVILAGGLVTIFVLSNPATSDINDAQISSTDNTNADGMTKPNTPEEGQEMTTPDGEILIPDVPAENSESTNPTKGNETTKDPTVSTKGNENTKDPTSPTKGNVTKDPTTPKGDNTQSTTAPTVPEETGPLIPNMPEVDVPEKDEVTYLEYYAMSAEEQASFINSFESYEAFFAWHKAAKEAYENDRIEIDGSTPIDLDDVVGGN